MKIFQGGNWCFEKRNGANTFYSANELYVPRLNGMSFLFVKDLLCMNLLLFGVCKVSPKFIGTLSWKLMEQKRCHSLRFRCLRGSLKRGALPFVLKLISNCR